MTPAVEGLNVVAGLSAMATLWWRRRAPLLIAGLTFVAAAVAPLAAGAAIVSVFTVAQYRRLRVGVLFAVLYLLPGMVGWVVTGSRAMSADAALGAVLFTAGALGWGVAARARREAMAALADRADRLQTEQEARIAEARRAERARLAAEMHDVLAHRLSMLHLHAGAMEVRTDAPAQQLARSARVIRTSAHLALEELRAVMGVLREDDGGATVPPPTATAVKDLVAELRDAGESVDDSAISVDLDHVPDDLGRHVYRIVQEGLTNARKHAPGRPVAIRLSGTPGADLEVEVANPVAVSVPGDTAPGAGLGLVGLRERVTSAGGTLAHGVEHEVHRLAARLPWLN